MTEKSDKEKYLDFQILQKILLIRQTQERDRDIVKKRQLMFLDELDAIPELQSRSIKTKIAEWREVLRKQKESFQWIPDFRRLRLAPATIVLTILLMLFSGVGATALAAQSALPGDTLYPVKAGLEDTRIFLERDAHDQTQLYLSFSQKRIDEIMRLVQEKRFSDLGFASKEFEASIEKTATALKTTWLESPEQGKILISQVTFSFISYASMLRDIQPDLPDATQVILENSILISLVSAGEGIEFTGIVDNITGTSWIVSGRTVTINEFTGFTDPIKIGNTVNVHAIKAIDGTLTALEITLSDENKDAGNIDEGDVNALDEGNVNDLDEIDVNDLNEIDVNDLNEGDENEAGNSNENNIGIDSQE